MFNYVDLTKIETPEDIQKSPMNLVICVEPYLESPCLAFIKYMELNKYNFIVHKYNSADDFYENISNLSSKEIDNIHAIITHNHTLSRSDSPRKIVDFIARRKRVNINNICICVAGILGYRRHGNDSYMINLKNRLDNNFGILIPSDLLEPNDWMKFIDSLVTLWFGNIQSIKKNRAFIYPTIDLVTEQNRFN